ncbi:hypothetical protein [uncultured Clostridium sp.]|uniref:hypothetical protein n=1 Tax=uncultured Clostridium sp. TaxID=59620 RepID=UPI00262C1ACD|nr:hypothetical protein [uncultured Clostridium sp.]
MELLEMQRGKHYINKIRYVYVIILLVTLIILLCIRPWIYSLNNSEYIVIGSVPSLLLALIIIQIRFIFNSKQKWLDVSSIIIGLIIAELIQSRIDIGTYDFMDIVYILLSIPIIFLGEKLLYKKKK